MDDSARVRKHESGHACVARALDLQLASVVGFGHRGETQLASRPPSKSLAEVRAHLEARGIYGLAGEAALEVLGDADPREGAETDRATALQVAQALDPDAPEACLGRLYDRSLTLARRHRAAITRFAETLRVNGDRLAGKQVEVALDAAFGAWPTPRLDHDAESRVLTRQRQLFESRMRDSEGRVADLDVWERRELMGDCEGAARAGLGLAAYRREGLYSPVKGA